MKIRVLSYNIHKGFSAFNQEFVLSQIRDQIRFTKADLVFLQEVQGKHLVHKQKIEDWPEASQFEFLADEVWPHFAYGLNSAYDAGHHGNAILSKQPILRWKNTDVSSDAWFGLRGRFEKRGLLHAVIETPARATLHAVSVHLGLFESDRKNQAGHLVKLLQNELQEGKDLSGNPLLIAGDFNDWNQTLSTILKDRMGLEEAFMNLTGAHAKSFPLGPFTLPLDRIYFKNLQCTNAELLAGPRFESLSDHFPLLADFI